MCLLWLLVMACALPGQAKARKSASVQRDRVLLASGIHFNSSFRPHDLMIANAGETGWYGSDIYTSDGADGQVGQEASSQGTVTYVVQLRRAARTETLDDGTVWNTRLEAAFISGNAGANGWTIRYFEGSYEITRFVTSEWGWRMSLDGPETANFRIEVTRDASATTSGVIPSQNALLRVSSLSGQNGSSNIADAVLAVTSLQKPVVTISDPGRSANIFALNKISGTVNDEIGGSASSGIEKVDVFLYRQAGADESVWDATTGQWRLNVWTPLPASTETKWERNTGLPAGANLPAGDYLISATAYDRAGNVSDPVYHGFHLLSAPAVGWSNGNPISCGGIRWPLATNTIKAGAVGHLSAFLATDFDQRNIVVEGQTTLQVLSDPCSYTWSVSGGSFQNGVNKGQSVIWVAPPTPGSYTIQLVVDDQNQANQPALEPGTRGDNTLSANDEPQKYSVTVNVLP